MTARRRRPRISVVMPLRNAARWLRDALDGLYAQTFTDFEILAIDDGSHDGTRRMLRAERDPRLKILETVGTGIAGALNAGLAAAAGDLIARQDGDDRSHPARFEAQVAALDRSPELSVLATCADFMDDSGAPLSNQWTGIVRSEQDPATTPAQLRALLPLTCCLVHGSVMMRTAVVRGAGGYRRAFAPAEDYDLWLRLLSGGHRLAKLPRRLYQYRVHATQSSASLRDLQTHQAVRAKLEYVRRRCGWLPARPALRIADRARGARVYRAAAPECGFRVADARERWDVLAVTDFESIEGRARSLRRAVESGGVVREGNLFVRKGASA